MYIRVPVREPARYALGQSAGPFEGTFTGTMTGDAGSSATITAKLTHSGSTVQGTVTIGDGLKLDFAESIPFTDCKLEPVDAKTFPVTGSSDAANPSHGTVTAKVTEPTPGQTFKEMGVNITITGDVAPGGSTISASVTLKPTLCKGRTIPVSLTKQTTPTGSLKGFAQAPTTLSPSFWADLVSFRPPTDIQRKVLQRGIPAFSFHRIEDGVGPVNLDYYPVQVSKFPRKRGVPLTATELLSMIRLRINDFIDKRLTWFSPLTAGDKVVWESPNPLGAVLHLDFYRLTGAMTGSFNIDDGSVVVSDFKPNYWRVYTIWRFFDHGHPVSGVREWGCKPEGSNYIFYTRAADRLTKSLVLPFKGDIYAAQHQLWLSFQKAIELFVNRNGGQAISLVPTAVRHDWGQIAGQYHHPTNYWLSKP